ncbi:MAG: HlyD family efflux transporter periplasmic adaptor subunit [Candidatus Thiodiazotropha sp. L084R]
MRIRNKKSFVVVGPEGKAPKSIWSKLTHVIYLLFLALLATYLIYFVFYRFTAFELQGQVSVERVKISALQGGRITVLKVDAGEHVKAGDQIVILETNEKCSVKSDKSLSKLKQSIALDQKRLKVLNNRKGHMENRKQGLLDERRLGRVLELERRQINEAKTIQRDLDELEMDIHILMEEIQLQQVELGQQSNIKDERDDCGLERILAPVDGKVVALNQHLYEVINRKDTILTLVPDKPEVWIEAFSKTDESLPSLSGQTVTVRLPNNVVTQGKVTSLRASAFPFPEREYDIYTPEESSLSLKVLPINSETAEQWSEFDRMAVTVEGER